MLEDSILQVILPHTHPARFEKQAAQDENFFPWAEIAESAKKLLEECRALAPHERRTLGGAEDTKPNSKSSKLLIYRLSP